MARLVNWLALLGTPSLALTVLTINYAAVTPACEQQANMKLHLVAAAGLLLSLLLSWLAWRNLRQVGERPDNSRRTADRKRLIAKVAVMVGLLSSLVIVAQWLPIWLLSPCA